jgi:hypothetical protein
MKALQLLMLFSIIVLSFTTCKRYPEGGWTNVAIKHLFGGHKKGSSKTWHLKKYEVNGIDSTMYITPGNGYTSFENDEYTFRIDNYSKNDYYGKSKIYIYTLYWKPVKTQLETRKKEINITCAVSAAKEQCSLGVCERNIFNPSYKLLGLTWKIECLKNNLFIISTQDEGNKYVITLTN